MAAIDCPFQDVISGCEVHGRYNGIPLHFTRRRYGKTTFTWLDWWNGSEWVSAGDPWPSIVIPQRLGRYFRDSGY